jgi:hypothetical protein
MPKEGQPGHPAADQHPRLDEDGIAVRNAKAAVSQFQQENGLTETGFADSGTIAAIERKLRLRPGEELPQGPSDIAAWLERLVRLVERLKAQRTTTAPPSATQQTDQLRKALELLTTILIPGDGRQSAAIGPGQWSVWGDVGQLAERQKDGDRRYRCCTNIHTVSSACRKRSLRH